jgi:hypothetical protein
VLDQGDCLGRRIRSDQRRHPLPKPISTRRHLGLTTGEHARSLVIRHVALADRRSGQHHSPDQTGVKPGDAWSDAGAE